MKKLLIIISLLFLSSLTVSAQRSADWKVEVEGSIQQLYFHELTGIPIAVTSGSYYGIDVSKQSVLWKVDRATFLSLSSVVETDANYQEVASTPYAIINHNLVDVRDGKLIMDKAGDQIKRIKDYDIIIPAGVLLVEAVVENDVKVFCVDVKQNKVQWLSPSIGSTSGLKEASKSLAAISNPFSPGKFLTMMDNNGNFIYKYGKNLVSLDKNTGAIRWNSELNPGYAFFNQSGDRLMVVEPKGGLKSMLAAATLSFAKAMALSKDVHGVDPETGKTLYDLKLDDNFVWMQDFGDNFFVATTGGGNFYKYADASKKWKKDFDEKRIHSIEQTPEGYLIAYANMRMMIGEDGKKVWKKAEEIDDVAEDVDYNRYDYESGYYLIAYPEFVGCYKTGEKKKLWSLGTNDDAKVMFDAANKNLVLLDGKSLYIINPEKNAAKPKGLKLSLEKADDISLVETRSNGYYISSAWEYVITDFSGNVKTQKYYTQPGETGRQLLSVGAGLLGAVGQVTVQLGAANVVFGAFAPAGQQASNNHSKGVNQVYAGLGMIEVSDYLTAIAGSRYNASKQRNNSAFFFTKGDNSQKLLVEVSKDSGEELDKLVFNNNKPLYQVDEVSKVVFYANNKEVQAFKMKQ